MRAKLKKPVVFLIALLLLIGLAAGAYAAYIPSSGESKDSKQTIGKNWYAKPGVIKEKGVPAPKKNLKDPAESTSTKGGSYSSDYELVGSDKNSR